MDNAPSRGWLPETASPFPTGDGPPSMAVGHDCAENRQIWVRRALNSTNRHVQLNEGVQLESARLNDDN